MSDEIKHETKTATAVDSQPGSDQRRGSADIKSSGLVAACSTGIKQVAAASLEADHMLAEHRRRGRQFGCRFSLHAHGRQHGGNLGFTAATTDHVGHYAAHLLGAQIAPLDQSSQSVQKPVRFLWLVHNGPRCKDRGYLPAPRTGVLA